MHVTRRRVATGALAALAIALPLVAASQADPVAPAALRLRQAAARLLASLDDGQRDEISYAFDDEERFDLRLAPILLDGLPLSDMTDEQRKHVNRLLAAGLSPAGFRKVQAIRSLEDEVRRGVNPLWRWAAGGFYDENRYHVAVFGDPSQPGAAPLGVRFDGHHVSVNFTLSASNEVAASPLFLGAQPARVPDDWERAGMRVLAQEEDLARALYLGLSPAQRASATLPFEASRGLFVGGARRMAPAKAARGVAHAALTAEQRRALIALIDVYLANFPLDLQLERRGAIERSGRDSIHFAWAGETEPGRPFYYRVQGASFLIELDNTEDDAQHVHAIWRDQGRDYGLDLLARHYEAHHATRLAAAVSPNSPSGD